MLIALGVAVSGVIIALRTDAPSLAVLFGLLAVHSATGLWPQRRRQTVELRADLMCWLERTSAVTAEPVEELLDRSVSAYRASVRRSDDE